MSSERDALYKARMQARRAADVAPETAQPPVIQQTVIIQSGGCFEKVESASRWFIAACMALWTAVIAGYAIVTEPQLTGGVVIVSGLLWGLSWLSYWLGYKLYWLMLASVWGLITLLLCGALFYAPQRLAELQLPF